MHTHLQEERQMASSGKEYVEIKCSNFLILVKVEGAWKNKKGFSALSKKPLKKPFSYLKLIKTIKMTPHILITSEIVSVSASVTLENSVILSLHLKWRGCSLNPDLNYGNFLVNIWFLNNDSLEMPT